MPQESTRILKEISQLINLIENSTIQKTDKLKIVRVLLTVKLKLIELLGRDLKIEAKTMHLASVAKSSTVINSDIILQFIKNNSGRVNAAKLLDLGIAGRTLRRYIKNLSASGKILVEKKGREHFYILI